MTRLARFAALFAQLGAGEWRAHPLRTGVAALAIAIGVALGFAVHLTNTSALVEFEAAARAASGNADVEVRGRGLAARAGFDEAVLARLVASPQVDAASPVLELDVPVLSAPREAGRPRPTLRVIGLDPLRAAHVGGALLPQPDEAIARPAFDDQALYLSPAAMAWLHVRPGDAVALQSGLDAQPFVVAGTVRNARAQQRVALVDIATAQSRFGRVGTLTRIDVKLSEGVDPQRWIAAFDAPADIFAVPSASTDGRVSNLSRAYRVNMNMLALVALFTGAFLVYSVQTLAVARRRAQFALARVLGLEADALVRQVVAEGAVLGVVGASLGLGLGAALAVALLRALGGDLGGGYFAGAAPSLAWSWAGAAIYGALGLAAAMTGAWMPARAASRAAPARALKGHDDAQHARRSPRAGFALIAASGALAWLPPVAGIALFGYLSIAGMLVGGVWTMPWVASRIARTLARRVARTRSPVPVLATERIANTPAQAGVVLAGVLTSFTLMVAMAIMVASFRHSVDTWLGAVLPADLYVRASQASDTASLPPALQRAMTTLPGAARVEFARVTQLALDPLRPSVALIAREIDDPARRLPLVGDPIAVTGPAIYVSEAMIDLYDWRVGTRVTLPLGGPGLTVTVAGVWRDYARQFGAIAIDRATYVRASGDATVTDAAVTLAADASAQRTLAALRALPDGDRLEVASARDIRAISLRVFDRSFAVTYVLEAVAMIIGLAGIAAAFGAQALARAKEFGMLRHLGVTRSQVLGVLTVESLVLTSAGVVAGFVFGALVALVLVEVVNPQSFHWTMTLHAPAAVLSAVTLALLVAAALTALLAGRAAVGRRAVLAVREDW